MLVKGNIAIDGPAGAGKSTVAKLVAEKLGYVYVDTGAMYRAIAWKCLRQKISPNNHKALANLAENTKIEFVIDKGTNKQHIICDGKDITQEIRSPEVSKVVSEVAKIPEVRSVMLKQQRLLAEKGSVVMDGRDIGSKVLPEAPFKFFLTASAEIRARRRYLELVSKGYKVDEKEILEEILQRDKNDQERSVAPLVKVPDAIEIDTSYLTPEKVAEKIIFIVQSKARANAEIKK